MPFPPPSLDVAFITRCPVCFGRGSSGTEGLPDHRTCAACQGFGWINRDPDQLTPEQATSARRMLEDAPADGDLVYTRISVLLQLRALLTGFTPATVDVPSHTPTEIHLTSATGNRIRIFPAFAGGKLDHLNVAPVPPAAPPLA